MNISLIAIILFTFIYCKADGIPPNIPQGAHYNKRTNLYQKVADGVSYSYFKDGKLYEKCEVNEMGKLHGLCENFLQSTGQKISWGIFQNGQRDGEWVWTFEDGSIFLKQEFTYGKKKDFWIPVEEWGNEDGNYSRFYPDGRLEEVG
ncbi:MAG: hypothetical protein JJT78_14255, partial [Leptospira sp.]|nr:hypothetical protein [Leptospira sp.]